MIYDPNDRAADIVLPSLIETWHLSGFTANEGTTIFLATTRKPADDFIKNRRFQGAGAHIIQEKERLSTKHQDIVDTVVDEVFAYRVMTARLEGNLQFSAHTIHTGHKHRTLELFEVRSEQPPKPAHLTQYLGAMG